MLPISTKAGAVLSRHCLEAVLTESSDHYDVELQPSAEIRRRIQEEPFTREAAELLGHARTDDEQNGGNPSCEKDPGQKAVAPDRAATDA